MIAQVEVERIKQETDLVALIQARGISLLRKGKSWQGRCPFHDDSKTPSLSISPDKRLWRCFGCNAGGDAIRFLELYDKLSFPEAIKSLGANPIRRAVEGNISPSTAAFSMMTTQAATKLLEQVLDFYQRSFADDPRGAAYLTEQRGIRQAGLFEAFRVGLSTGKLRETLPKEGEIVDGLKHLGVLTERGTELFYGSIVFPLYAASGEIVSLYGRRILTGETRHLYLPGPRKGLFNRHAAKAGKEVILVEGILDALALIDCGYSSALPLDGTEGLRDEHLELFRAEGVKEIYVALDGDSGGRAAAEKVAARLRTEQIRAVVVALPEGSDPNDIVKTGRGRAFEALLRAADPQVAERPSMPFHSSRHGYTRTPEGFRVQLGEERIYEVRGIAKASSHLRCAIRAARGARFHLDTLDLYSAKARQQLARSCSELFSVPETVVSEDVTRILEYAEAWEPGEKGDEAARVTISDQERKEALALLEAPDLLDRIGKDLGLTGSVVSDENRLVGYLAALSRKLEEPLSVLILSRSSAGKSFLADSITRFVPPEELRRYTRVTGQALFYAEEDALRNKLVAIEEAAGAQDAAYSIRTLQSAGELRIAVTTKDPRDGRLRTDEYTVKGPAAFLVSSTQSEIDPETQSRFVILTVDESTATTEKILQAQRYSETLDGLRRRRQSDIVAKRHHMAQRLIESMAIVNPYAPKLRFPTHTLRARRDHKKYLSLIQSVALLHQHQRERKTLLVEDESVSYIEVTISDILFANRLSRAVFARTLDPLSPQARNLLGEIRVLCEDQSQGEVMPEYTFRRRDLRKRCGWSETQLRQYFGELEQYELIEPVAGRQGKEYVYHLSYDEEGRPTALDLVTEEELRS